MKRAESKRYIQYSILLGTRHMCVNNLPKVLPYLLIIIVVIFIHSLD